MRIYFLVMAIIHAFVYGIFARLVKPQSEQEEALAELTHSLLFDPLNITKKGKKQS